MVLPKETMIQVIARIGSEKLKLVLNKSLVFEVISMVEVKGWKILTYNLIEDIEVEKVDIVVETSTDVFIGAFKILGTSEKPVFSVENKDKIKCYSNHTSFNWYEVMINLKLENISFYVVKRNGLFIGKFRSSLFLDNNATTPKSSSDINYTFIPFDLACNALAVIDLTV